MKRTHTSRINTSQLFSAAALVLCLAQSALAQNPAADATANTISAPGAQAHQRIVTPSGLQYEDIAVGTGAEAHAGMKVSVHYTGWLKSRDGSTGKKFDSSRDRNEPFRFFLGGGQVIQGWDEGVQGMRVGGVRRLIVPSALGYGMRGAGSAIPPNATLLFEIELLSL